MLKKFFLMTFFKYYASMKIRLNKILKLYFQMSLNPKIKKYSEGFFLLNI